LPAELTGVLQLLGWGASMNLAEQIESMRIGCIRSHVLQGESEFADEASKGRGSLAEMLLAIEEKRGALYMRDISHVLIESWNLRADRLDMQSPATLELLAKLLKL
jgi:hypothetical protein